MSEYFKRNKELWEAKTLIHKDSEYYDIKGFIEGREPLDPLIIEQVGEVNRKKLLHLQCHLGIETLSWQRRGAKAVGIDFSSNAIEFARNLSKRLNLGATFIEANVYDLPDVLNERFDIVFVSEGSLVWLDDLERWAEIVYDALLPGGILYVFDFHPFGYIFDDEREEPSLVGRYSYFQGKEPLSYISNATYTDMNKELEPMQAYEWNHSVSTIINSIVKAGLKVEFFNEYPFSTFRQLRFMERSDDGKYVLPDTLANVPFLFSLKASK